MHYFQLTYSFSLEDFFTKQIAKKPWQLTYAKLLWFYADNVWFFTTYIKHQPTAHPSNNQPYSFPLFFPSSIMCWMMLTWCILIPTGALWAPLLMGSRLHISLRKGNLPRTKMKWTMTCPTCKILYFYLHFFIIN